MLAVLLKEVAEEDNADDDKREEEGGEDSVGAATAAVAVVEEMASFTWCCLGEMDAGAAAVAARGDATVAIVTEADTGRVVSAVAEGDEVVLTEQTLEADASTAAAAPGKLALKERESDEGTRASGIKSASNVGSKKAGVCAAAGLDDAGLSWSISEVSVAMATEPISVTDGFKATLEVSPVTTFIRSALRARILARRRAATSAADSAWATSADSCDMVALPFSSSCECPTFHVPFLCSSGNRPSRLRSLCVRHGRGRWLFDVP